MMSSSNGKNNNNSSRIINRKNTTTMEIIKLMLIMILRIIFRVIQMIFIKIPTICKRNKKILRNRKISKAMKMILKLKSQHKNYLLKIFKKKIINSN